MGVQVRVFATLRDLLGAKQVEVSVDPPTTVETVLLELTTCYPAIKAKLWAPEGGLNSSIRVLVNGRAITYLAGLATPVGPEDSLAVFPAVGGG